jgi:hypothetical protein
MSSIVEKFVVLAMVAGCSIQHVAAEEASKGVDLREINSAVWIGKALMVERKLEAKWLPVAQVPLRAGGRFGAGDGLSFAVWHEGSARRVEISCGANEWAWEGLRPGASAQLEFGCGSMRYRAQVGSVGMGPDRLSLRPGHAGEESVAAERPAEGSSTELPADTLGKISERAKLVSEAIEAARLAAKSVVPSEQSLQSEAEGKPAMPAEVEKASMPPAAVKDEAVLLPVKQEVELEMGADGAIGVIGAAKE